MIKRQNALRIRKIHRYLGLFIGIQFLMWTISGLYFSWTDLDNIHGDQFKNMNYEKTQFDNLISPSTLDFKEDIYSIDLRDISKQPYYWVNNSQLFNAQTGNPLNEISKENALDIAAKRMNSGLEVSGIEKISSTGKHHEYREKLLPAYVISYTDNNEVKSYVSITDGKFQTVRHRDWRWFDFLWMTHTMDYEGRDDFNNLILRIFSLLGLLTVCSGFLLWYTSSLTVRKISKNIKTSKK
ncbi:PepSY domain-containing protein [Urechidicola vernalis]|uniref:PepSY domain-containing protein n=1 Tax=Urechidicola vernalis TaxID=3075600 RepID=A0ABU2Y447_9FLAO|nr:PepSY domain-containing protein [Urechidicola sp. P050]MDT0551818.1 PepSY domain-containing protein [Urechidicola sp. P050]